MGTRELGLAEMTDVMIALNSYREMAIWISVIDKEQEETVKPWYDKQLKQYGDKGYVGQNWYRVWSEVDMHVVNQIWPSTACGWGGIGGAAMTAAYTVVITNKQMNTVYVYWSGKLAYIANWNEKIQIQRMPGMRDCDKILDIIYKKSK